MGDGASARAKSSKKSSMGECANASLPSLADCGAIFSSVVDLMAVRNGCRKYDFSSTLVYFLGGTHTPKLAGQSGNAFYAVL